MIRSLALPVLYQKKHSAVRCADSVLMKSAANSIHPDDHRSHGTLLRVLGVGFGLAVTIGGTIGMGILRTPGEVAAQLPTPKLFLGVWILGGVYALLGAITVAE